MDKWMVLRASEEGNPIMWLFPGRLAEFLENPTDWGVKRFVHLDDLNHDPNYWPEDVGVLIKYEVVIPVPAGAYKLPEEN